MKKLLCGVAVGVLAFSAAPAFASKMAISGAEGMKKGEVRKLVLTLSKESGAPLAFSDLKEVHTSRLHLLVIDDSMTDYQHIHPQADKEPGQYVFDFTPHTAHNYTVWADITPVKGAHEYLGATLQGEAPCGTGCIDKTASLKSAADGLSATLSFDDPLRVGEASMGTLELADASGHPVKDLEPVMGAFGHIVGFYAAQPGVVHTHPMGDEPKALTERGGPELMFHLEPSQAGIIKLFAQVKRGGKDVFLPFTLSVKK